MEKTPDIAAKLGKMKAENKEKKQVIVGFALETNNEVENALSKLERKNFDFIVLNSLQNEGAGFNHDTNKIQILFNSEHILDFPLKSKTEVAADIITELAKII